VRSPKQNCPRCNAEQSFRERTEEREGGTIAVFIACTLCRWRQDLRVSTKRLEQLKAGERKLLERSRREHERHGTTSGATRRLLVNVRALMRLEREAAGL
jgi:hypothetical protein